MCGIVITVDGGGGDGRQQRDGNAMRDGDGGSTNPMGNGGGGAMDGRMMEGS